MRNFILSLVSSVLLAPLFVGCKENVQIHSFAATDGVLALDSQTFTVASVELPYALLPREYWDERMEFIKQMGFNTLFVRVPWCVHEPDSGVYDFSGDRDINYLCRMAQEKNLMVWLHIGPAVDASMDIAGLPWWLLKNNRVEFTLKNPLFCEAVGRYYSVLAAELANMQLSEGGPIAMIQIGEPECVVDNDKYSIATLRSLAVDAGFDATLFTSSSHSYNVGRILSDSVCCAVLVGKDNHAMSNFTSIRKFDASAPFIAYDIDRRSPEKYGKESSLREWNKVYMRMFELLTSMASFNISSFCTGTYFGHLAGAEISDKGYYIPYSVYSDAPMVDEAARVDASYEQFASLLNSYIHNSQKEGTVEFDTPSLQEFESVAVESVAPLFDNLPQPIASHRPLTLEQCNVSSGAILYTTKLPPTQGNEQLFIPSVHDNAQLFFDGQPIAALSRNDSNKEYSLPASPNGITLQILVDAMGRVGNKRVYKDFKGIIGAVKLKEAGGAVSEILGWENQPLPAEYPFVQSREYRALKVATIPGFYKIDIPLKPDKDFYLNLSMWSRGEAWINGHSLGRFWNKNGNSTLYVPGCWLKSGNNELIILDWVGPVAPVVSGVKVR